MPPRKQKEDVILEQVPGRREILRHFLARDPKIAAVIRAVGPFRLKRNRNYFLVLCKAIIAQQISTRAADAIIARFLRLFGGAPTPEKIFNIAPETLRVVGLSMRKVDYLRDLSSRFLDRSIRPHRLPYLDNETVIETLTAVHGIGRWTAEMFLIFSLNRLDVLPVGDWGFRAALKNIYNMRGMPTAKRIKSMGKKWHPYETIATWYSWRTLDAKVVAY